MKLWDGMSARVCCYKELCLSIGIGALEGMGLDDCFVLARMFSWWD